MFSCLYNTVNLSWPLNHRRDYFLWGRTGVESGFELDSHWVEQQRTSGSWTQSHLTSAVRFISWSQFICKHCLVWDQETLLPVLTATFQSSSQHAALRIVCVNKCNLWRPKISTSIAYGDICKCNFLVGVCRSHTSKWMLMMLSRPFLLQNSVLVCR